jgi:hypothetical protein
MQKLLLVVFLALALTASTMVSSSEETQASAAAPSVNKTIVTVSFSGLMVFHKENGKSNYEVGILSPEVAQDHTFTVKCNGVPKERRQLPDGRSWTLEITNAQSISEVRPTERGHAARRPDNREGQHDFSWIVDLESSEFHGRSLNLKPGLLTPIIHLPNVGLYTKYKSIDLRRGQGSDASTDFGFVAETIALDVELHEGQNLVLRDDVSGREVFRLAYDHSHASYVVSLNNIREVPGEDSDFRIYYKLFNNVPELQQFDFYRNESSKLMAFNPSPMAMTLARGHHSRNDPMPTCCGLLCDGILLGKRTKPLE